MKNNIQGYSEEKLCPGRDPTGACIDLLESLDGNWVVVVNVQKEFRKAESWKIHNDSYDQINFTIIIDFSSVSCTFSRVTGSGSGWHFCNERPTFSSNFLGVNHIYVYTESVGLKIKFWEMISIDNSGYFQRFFSFKLHEDSSIFKTLKFNLIFYNLCVNLVNYNCMILYLFVHYKSYIIYKKVWI